MSGTKPERVKRMTASFDDIVKRRNELITVNPNLSRIDAMKQARNELKSSALPGSTNNDPY